MRIITGNRGSGLSTSLVLESAQFNIPILTFDAANCRYLKDIAEQMGLSIPKPINLSQSDPNVYYNLRDINAILIDDASGVIYKLLQQKGFQGKIIAAGLNFDGVGF